MTHEFDGEKYEKASTHQKEWGSKLIDEFDLTGTERVLDLGCGDGTLTAQLAALLPQGEVVGIDASKGMIEAALPKAGKNLRFRRLDINRPRLRRGVRSHLFQCNTPLDQRPPASAAERPQGASHPWPSAF